jgi:hypothetical protein
MPRFQFSGPRDPQPHIIESDSLWYWERDGDRIVVFVTPTSFDGSRYQGDLAFAGYSYEGDVEELP